MTSPAAAPDKYLLILELTSTGHHATYVSWLLDSGLAKSRQVILAGRKELFSHPALAALSDRYIPSEIGLSDSDSARLKDMSPGGLIRGSWITGRIYRRVFRDLARRYDIDFVVVAFLDDCLLGLSAGGQAFSGTPWIAITMRTMFHFPDLGIRAPPQKFTAARRWMFERLVHQRSLAAIFSIDPTLIEYATAHPEKHYERLRYLPDPAADHGTLPTAAAARAGLGVPEDCCLVSLYGEIAPRKGVFELLQAAADPDCSARIHVLLAGRCQDSDRLTGHPGYVSLRAQGRLHRIEGFLSDMQEKLVLAASDCVWLGYSGFYLMSGVMVLAGRYGVPVLACRDGLIGYTARKHDLGLVVDVASPPRLLAALNELAAHPQELKRRGAHGISLFARHDPAEMQRLITEAAAQALT